MICCALIFWGVNNEKNNKQPSRFYNGEYTFFLVYEQNNGQGTACGTLMFFYGGKG